jgi:thioredoxin-dependent peroxiredoxin
MVAFLRLESSLAIIFHRLYFYYAYAIFQTPIMSNIPQTGQPAPDFSTPDQNDNLVSLDNFSGQWVVLYFYPKDDTPGCTTEAKDFTELYQDFSQLGAKILGVSPDSGKAHCKFINKHNLSITLLSDPEHLLIEAYGAWRLKKFMGKEYMGVARSTFLISPDKIIAYAWPNVKTKDHAQAVLTKLQELANI